MYFAPGCYFVSNVDVHSFPFTVVLCGPYTGPFFKNFNPPANFEKLKPESVKNGN